MSNIAIKVEGLSKAYQLGEIGTGTISRDLERWWARFRGKDDPFLRIGETNDRSVKGTSDIVWSLKDLNFEIEQGDAVGIIGRNGAGKSTLLKILSRVTSPTTGSAKVKGRIASLLEVGTGFHPELTGRENMFLNGAILGMRKAEIKRKFEEIVDFSGVERYIDTPVKRYSSGMYVRLAFAVAAHLESEILVVDEVLAVGDAEFQKKCLGKMGDVSKGEGRTVLFVSHNMGSIGGLCNKGILLSNGAIHQTGNISDAIDSYVADQAQEGEIPLAARKTREGLGGIRIEKIDFSPTVITTFKPLSIIISFKNKGRDIKIREAGISIWTRDGFRLISISTDFTGGMNSVQSSKIACVITRLPLIEGNYKLNAFISSDNGLEDYITSAKTLTVTHSDYFGSGKTVDPQWGTLAVEHSWEFNI
ncbi:ABC transporter ATP-binding protein [Pedobacter heparinus]|uniref:ABC transporter ATP-binding protein n=1 Tax=Pedobacter heparinus TaxID=984 RepID=UPI00292E46E8|nr:ABC transporter ATP-binding protein [Pedobacter heparinus]